jgi:hypothetical protein
LVQKIKTVRQNYDEQRAQLREDEPEMLEAL